jgi:gliding motility-associated-like protein
MTLLLERNHDIFIPNIFTPNGDGINDEITVSTGSSIRRILSFEIFDRWGNMTYEIKDIQPNDPSIAWDGRMDGESMNPGVIAYRVIVEDAQGRQIVQYGDITLIR